MVPNAVPERRRADAENNRRRILAAAREAMAESGDVPLQAIARRAGVGQGTLYRHFPSREALVLEVHRRDVDALVKAAPDLLARHAPLVALRAWLDQLAEYGRIKRGLANAFWSSTHDQLAAEGYQPVVDAIELLLGAGRRQGSVRSDLAGADLLLLVAFLWRRDDGADAQARSRQLLDVVMDGLTRAAEAPGRPARPS